MTEANQAQQMQAETTHTRTLVGARTGGRRAVALQTYAVLGALVFGGTGCSGGGDDSPTPASSPTPEPTPTAIPTPFDPDWVAHTEELMSFWEGANRDTSNGGYFTYVSRTGQVSSNRDKWTRMVSREVYGFTRAFQLTGETRWLEHARLGVDWLLGLAHDPVHGGFYQLLSTTGEVKQDGRSLFDLAYALNGLAAYFEVTHDPEVGTLLEEEYARIDGLAWDSLQGGYFNALNVEMTQVSDRNKSFNAQVDMMSAWMFTWYAATGKTTVRERLETLGLNVVSHVIDPDGRGWIGELFDEDWNYLPEQVPYGADRTICGHNFKTVWVLGRLYALGGSSLFLSNAEELLDKTLSTCRDVGTEGIFDQVDRKTSTVVGYDSNPANADQKPWWQQEQALFALRYMNLFTSKSYYDKVHDATLDFYLRHFPDPEYGEVFATVYGDGTPKDMTKGNDTKSAYHSTETAYFSLLYDQLLRKGGRVTLYYAFDAHTEDRTVRLVPLEAPYETFEVKSAALSGTSLSLSTPSTVKISAGTAGIMAVTYGQVD